MPTPSELRVHPLTSAVGAVIEGVDLCQLQKPETLHGIRQALREHGVVFFRGQDDVTVQQLWEFLRPFGTPQVEDSFGSDDDVPEQVETADFQLTKGGTAVWHADSTFLARPPKITLLRMVKTPPWGGDTCWASMSAAYEALSEPVRELLDGLSAIHSIDPPLSRLETSARASGRPSSNDTPASRCTRSWPCTPRPGAGRSSSPSRARRASSSWSRPRAGTC